MEYYAKKNVLLIDHSSDVVQVIEKLDWLSHSRVKRKGKVAGALHDIGKTAKRFQEMLAGKIKSSDLRHEAYSYFIYRILNEMNIIEYDADVALAILLHHKRLQDLKKKANITRRQLEFNSLTSEIEKHLQLIGINTKIDEKELEKTAKAIEKKVQAEIKTLSQQKIAESVSNDYLLVRGALMQADHIASWSEGVTMPINVVPKVNRKLEINPYHFQKLAMKTNKPIVIIEAPTGAGKTEAALLYAQKYGRVIYALNTKASINAMYPRFIKYFGAESVSLEYSDLATYIEFLDEQGIIDDPLSISNKDLASLYKKSARPAKITTFFQPLKAIYPLKEAPLRAAELANSVLVLDEVHSFFEDDYTFADTVNLVAAANKFFNTRSVIMTATMPDKLVEEIKNAIGEENIEYIDAYDEFNPVRHNFEIVDDDLLEVEVKKEGDKIRVGNIVVEPPVLVVLNTVNRAIEFFRKAEVGKKVLLHSQFKISDRLDKETKILKKYSDYDLIVTTQVVEASVDISAKTLLTDYAPLPAIIQRAGRVNRRKPYKYPEKPNVYVFAGIKRSAKNWFLPYEKHYFDEKVLNDIEGIVSMKDERDAVKEYYNRLEKTLMRSRLKYNVYDLDYGEFVEEVEGSSDYRDYFKKFDGIKAWLYEDYKAGRIDSKNAFNLSIEKVARLIREEKAEVIGNVVVLYCKYDEVLGLNTSICDTTKEDII